VLCVSNNEIYANYVQLFWTFSIRPMSSTLRVGVDEVTSVGGPREDVAQSGPLIAS